MFRFFVLGVVAIVRLELFLQNSHINKVCFFYGLITLKQQMKTKGYLNERNKKKSKFTHVHVSGSLCQKLKPQFKNTA